MSPDPIAFGQAAAHSTLAQDRRPFTVLRGGGGRPGQLRPVRSHVTDLRSQHAQAVAAGRPSALPPYDHSADPDRPNLPLEVKTALSVLVRHALTPGAVQRSDQTLAAACVRAWLRPDLADECAPHGIPRPGGAS